MSVRNDILESIRLDINELKNDSTSGIDIATVSLYNENILTLNKFDKPMVMIVDSFGEDEVHNDGTDSVALWQIGFYCVNDGEQGDDLFSSMNRMIALLKKYIKSKPTLPQVYSLSYTRTTTKTYKDRNTGDSVIEFNVLYYATEGDY